MAGVERANMLEAARSQVERSHELKTVLVDALNSQVRAGLGMAG